MQGKFHDLSQKLSTWVKEHEHRVKSQTESHRDHPSPRPSDEQSDKVQKNNPFALLNSKMATSNKCQRCSQFDTALVNFKDLEKCLNDCADINRDIAQLKLQFDTSSSVLDKAFKTMRGSLVYRADCIKKDKPFLVSRGQLQQLAYTPEGYGMGLLDTCEVDIQQRIEIKDRIDVQNDMMQSLMTQTIMNRQDLMQSVVDMRRQVGGVNDDSVEVKQLRA